MIRRHLAAAVAAAALLIPAGAPAANADARVAQGASLSAVQPADMQPSALSLKNCSANAFGWYKNTSYTIKAGDMCLGTNPKAYKTLRFQKDGNLVRYRLDAVPEWATGTNGKAVKMVGQPDGNLVMYNARNQPVWATGTNVNCGLALYNDNVYWLAKFQDDFNFVLYIGQGDHPIKACWSSAHGRTP